VFGPSIQLDVYNVTHNMHTELQGDLQLLNTLLYAHLKCSYHFQSKHQETASSTIPPGAATISQHLFVHTES